MFSRHRGWDTRTTTTGNVVPFRGHVRSTLASLASRRDDDEPVTSTATPGAKHGLLDDAALRAIESSHAEGLTAVQIVGVFTSRGVKFSEASFRKYVQQGLLPRSRRVGRKGKHRGSLGLYPAKTVRRINRVKQLMSDGHTIEEIQDQFLAYTDLIETITESLTELWSRLDDDLESTEPKLRRELHHELTEVHRDGDRLVERLSTLERRVSAPRTDTVRLAGAAGSAEDLF